MYQIIPAPHDARSDGDGGFQKPSNGNPFGHEIGMSSYRRIIKWGINEGRITKPGRYMVVSMHDEMVTEISPVFTVESVPAVLRVV
jgi:hypothetical protein